MVMTMSANNAARKAGVVSAAEFKAKCLSLFDEVAAERSSFVVTKRGKPVARVVPLAIGAGGTGNGSLRGSLLYEEGLLDPVAAEWEAHG